MQTATWKAKVFGTLFAFGFMAFWAVVMVAIFWETTSFRCQPGPASVQCSLINEPFPGGQRLVSVGKSEASSVKLARLNTKKRSVRVVLVKTDGQEIPFTRGWDGDSTVQLEPRLPEINAFLADPRAENLDIGTQRRFPPLALLMTLGVLAFNAVMLKRLWFGFTPKLSVPVGRRVPQ